MPIVYWSLDSGVFGYNAFVTDPASDIFTLAADDGRRTDFPRPRGLAVLFIGEVRVERDMLPVTSVATAR